MTPEEIRKLLSLATTIMDRDIANFANASKRLELLKLEIDQFLKDSMRQQSQVTTCFKTIAVFQGWVEKEKQKYDLRRRELVSIVEQARAPAMTSSARVQSLELLLKKAERNELMENRKRAEQNGVPPDA